MNDGKFDERDRLVKAFAYEFVCFNYDVHNSQPFLVVDVTDDCMLELEGMSGLFAPDLFKRVRPTDRPVAAEPVEDLERKNS